MLLSQNRCWHKKCNLLSIRKRLEGSPNSNLCFPVAHITAKQTVHWSRSFHILLNFMDGAELIFRFLISKGSFKLSLHITVRREGITYRCFTLCVKLN